MDTALVTVLTEADEKLTNLDTFEGSDGAIFECCIKAARSAINAARLIAMDTKESS